MAASGPHPGSPQDGLGALGIIAGGGRLPRIVAEAAMAAGRPVVLVALSGEAGADIASLSPVTVKWGEIGRLFRVLRDGGVSELVLAGAVTRPDWQDISIDFGGLASLPRLYQLLRGGDDAVLVKVVRFIEENGFRVIGAHMAAPHLLAASGLLTRAAPDAGELEDIAAGFAAARALGALDIGQACIAHGGRVIAAEGLEGTDGLLARAVSLRETKRWRTKGRAGVLVKTAKPQQDMRVDVPVTGPDTVAKVAAAGLRGLAVEAGRVLMIDRDEMIRAADAAGIFISVC